MNFDPRALISGYLDRLQPRERVLVSVMFVLSLLGGLYAFVWEPLEDGRHLLETKIAKREKELVRMQQQRDSYLDIKRRVAANESAIAKAESKFNLFSVVQATVAQAVSREKIASMNPSSKDLTAKFQEERVEIKLTQVNLQQILTLLHKIEKGEHQLRFSRMQVKKRRDDSHSFDVTATVSLLKSSAGAAGES